jgi:hypothetical protein
MNLIHHDVTQNVTKLGQPISFRRKVGEAPVVGVQYDYVNAAIHGAAIGTIYHTSGEHALSINSLDKDSTNHYDAIAAIPIGATITIGSQSALMPVKATYIAGGMWSLTLDAWPDLPDGTYTVTVTP